MDRDELGKMKLEALRLLAVERGMADARTLGKAELIDRLAPKTLVERAKEAVAHAVERVEEKLRHHDAGAAGAIRRPPSAVRSETETETETRAEPAEGGRRKAEGEAFGVPSSTVHPHAAPRNGHHGEPMGMLDLEELPETYGVDECELLYKDPFWVFAYWEVTDHGLSAARAQLGQSASSARLVMRLFTTLPGPEGVDRQINDVELSWNHGRRYLQAPKPGAHLRVAVGLLSNEGYFAPIAHSSLVRVPPADPQPGHVEWMEVVPPRSRGRHKEPIVIVRRGGERSERGVKAPEGFGLEDEGHGGSSPSGRRPGAPGFPFGASSSPSKRDGGR